MKVIAAIRRRNNNLQNSRSETPKTQSEQNHNSEINTRESPIRWTDKSIAIGTIILAVTTIGLTIFTYFLFKEAVNEGTANDKRFTADTAALNVQIKNSEKTYELNKRSTDSSIALSRATLQQQITSLQENKIQFEKLHEPYLQITQMETIEFVVGKPIYLREHLSNLGDYPVKILEAKTATATKVEPPEMPEFKNFIADATTRINGYVIKEQEQQSDDTEKKPLTKARYDYVINKNAYIYYYGYIEYQNLVNQDIKLYRFMIRFKPSDEGHYEYFHNDNYEFHAIK